MGLLPHPKPRPITLDKRLAHAIIPLRIQEKMRKENEEKRYESSEGALFVIWKNFWKSHRGPEDVGRRDKALNECLDNLPGKEVRRLTETEEEGGLSLLAQIREKARKTAEQEGFRSKGERLHERRVKAQQRRGTDPHKIN